MQILINLFVNHSQALSMSSIFSASRILSSDFSNFATPMTKKTISGNFRHNNDMDSQTSQAMVTIQLTHSYQMPYNKEQYLLIDLLIRPCHYDKFSMFYPRLVARWTIPCCRAQEMGGYCHTGSQQSTGQNCRTE